MIEIIDRCHDEDAIFRLCEGQHTKTKHHSDWLSPYDILALNVSIMHSFVPIDDGIGNCSVFEFIGKAISLLDLLHQTLME